MEWKYVFTFIHKFWWQINNNIFLIKFSFYFFSKNLVHNSKCTKEYLTKWKENELQLVVYKYYYSSNIKKITKPMQKQRKLKSFIKIQKCTYFKCETNVSD